MSHYKRKAPQWPRILVCAECGMPFAPPQQAHRVKYCSDKCKRTAVRRQSKERHEREKALKAGKAKRGYSAHRDYVLRREEEFRRAVDIKTTVTHTVDPEGRRLRVVTRH